VTGEPCQGVSSSVERLGQQEQSKSAELDGFAEVAGGDVFRGIEVGNSACNLQDVQ
jgi:hypothetical protein